MEKEFLILVFQLNNEQKGIWMQRNYGTLNLFPEVSYGLNQYLIHISVSDTSIIFF